MAWNSCISLLKRSLPGYQYCCVGKTWTERLPRQRRSRSRVKPGAAKGFHSIKPPEEEASKCNLNCVEPARFCTCCVQPLGRGNSRLFTLMATIHYSGDTDVRAFHSCTHSLRHQSHNNNHNNNKEPSLRQTLIAARSCVMTSASAPSADRATLTAAVDSRVGAPRSAISRRSAVSSRRLRATDTA